MLSPARRASGHRPGAPVTRRGGPPTGGARRRPGTVGGVRIIAGTWRGRRLPVPDAPGLRPSPDRLRETLFAWLGPYLPGARCVDLFAGTGALGLEAASRGAAGVTLVERDRGVADALAGSLRALGADDTVTLVRRDWRAALDERPGPYDVAFVDPPFDAGWQVPALERLAAGALAPGARVHVEMPVTDARRFEPPARYGALRDKRFGDVVARLLVFEGA